MRCWFPLLSLPFHSLSLSFFSSPATHIALTSTIATPRLHAAPLLCAVLVIFPDFKVSNGCIDIFYHSNYSSSSYFTSLVALILSTFLYFIFLFFELGYYLEMDKILDKKKKSLGIIVLLFFSIIGATANTVLFKITLNSFSSAKTNYGFFVSQFSTFLYTFQALIVSIILIWRDPSSMNSLTVKNQPVYLYMGGLDAASATLGAIAGAYCPGGMQTILNQLIIPLTMIGAVLVLGTKFDRHQIWGSSFILFGSMVASSNYLFSSSHESASSSMSLSASITLYFFSIIPCAMSNIYKERVMKELDMNEVHTSTVVSFWQLWIGFFFLPLLSLKSLGRMLLK